MPDLGADDRFAVFGPGRWPTGWRRCGRSPCARATGASVRSTCTGTHPGSCDAGDMAAAQILADVTAAYLVNAQARADLQASSLRFEESSTHDALTGLPNRALLIERLDHVLSRSSRSDKIVAVLYMDLDRFKDVNDAHGHGCGDELLIAVAQRLVWRPAPGGHPGPHVG